MRTFNRRDFLRGGAAAGLFALCMGSRRTYADPDLPAGTLLPAVTGDLTDSPAIYAFQIGKLQAYVILDGALRLPAIQPFFAPEATPDEIKSYMTGAFLPSDHISLGFNVLALKTDDGVTLIDAGAGGAFGAAGGRLLKGLARIGVAPGDVKSVLITHAHMDHIGGLVDASGKPVFPNAQILIPKTEAEFWTGKAPDMSLVRISATDKAGIVASIQKVLATLKPSLKTIQPGAVSSNIELIPAYGHTPGHSIFKISSDNQSLLVIGDAVHVSALQFAHPEWTMAFDSNPAMAIQSRLKIFKDTAADQTKVMGYHMPFPGIGHIRTQANAFEWVPQPWII